LGAKDAVEVAPTAVRSSGGLVASIEDLSDDEVDRLLARRASPGT
jgi:hypothetical protein